MTGPFGSHGLIVPLDLARFALAYIIVALLPGYAIATLLRPRSPNSERLAMAIPCACALVALCGLGTALLHAPFGLQAYASMALPITVAGAVVLWRRRAAQVPRDVNRWWLIPIGAAIAQVSTILAVYWNSPVPSGNDVISHAIWTNLIGKSHIFPMAMSSSQVGGNDGGFYPPVYHALTALILWIAPMPTYRALFYGVVIAIAFLPLALYSYTRVATGSDRIGGWAALAAVAFESMPFLLLELSFYPLLLASLCVPALVIALRDALGQGDRSAVILAALLGIGLLYTHPTEIVSVALLCLAVIPQLLRRTGTWMRAVGYVVLLGAVGAAAAWPALRAIRNTVVNGAQVEMKENNTFTQAPHLQVHLAQVVDGYVYWVFTQNLSYVLLGASLIGVAWCLWHRRFLGLVVVQGTLVAVFIDGYTYDILRRFYAFTYPWALFDRLAATHYWFLLPLAAIGIDTSVRGLRRLLLHKHVIFIALCASPVVALGVVLPLTVAEGRTAAYTYDRQVITREDVAGLAWLETHSSADSVVLNDVDMKPPATFDETIDAGLWMPVLSTLRPLFGRQASGPGSLDDRLFLLQHVADVPLPPRAARFLSRYQVHYIYYAAAVRPGAARHLKLRSLLRDPLLRLVYPTGACRDYSGRHRATCFSTSPYIFTFSATSPVVKPA